MLYRNIGVLLYLTVPCKVDYCPLEEGEVAPILGGGGGFRTLIASSIRNNPSPNIVNSTIAETCWVVLTLDPMGSCIVFVEIWEASAVHLPMACPW